MQIPLIRGRLITEQDTATSPPVVLINETMARRFFPDEDPIGKRLDMANSISADVHRATTWSILLSV